MKSHVLLAAAALFLSSICLAESEAELNAHIRQHDAEMKAGLRRIPEVVARYGNALGCQFTMNPANVAPYTLGTRNGYVALFSLDEGCSMGSAMSRPVIVFLEQSQNATPYVKASYSAPGQTSPQLPVNMQRLYLRGTELWYSGLASKPEDPLCCPSGKVEGRLEFKQGQWQDSQQR
jgi:hypothetical protein